MSPPEISMHAKNAQLPDWNLFIFYVFLSYVCCNVSKRIFFGGGIVQKFNYF